MTNAGDNPKAQRFCWGLPRYGVIDDVQLTLMRWAEMCSVTIGDRFDACSECLETRRGSVEEGLIYLFGLLHCDPTELPGQSECRHEVRTLQSLQFLSIHPFGGLVVLTDRTMAVSAG